MKCSDCDARATWMLYSQLGFDYPFCDEHASEKSDLDQLVDETLNFDWHQLEDWLEAAH